MIHWLSVAFSTYVLHPLHGNGYQWLSGGGSDLGEVALVGAALGLIRHHNCHVHGCWRVGRHPVEGTPYRTCGIHHPNVPSQVTSQHIEQAHAEAQRDAIKVREGA